MTKEKLKTNGSISEESTAITKPDYENEIVSVIRGNLSPLVMQERLEDYHGNDIAQVLERLSPQERKKLCRICTVDMLCWRKFLSIWMSSRQAFICPKCLFKKRLT